MKQGEPMKETQVNSKLNEMDELLVEIGKSISTLDSRLRPVLNEPQPTEQDGSKNTVSVLVPLADDLDHKNKMLRIHLASLNDLRHRLEI